MRPDTFTPGPWEVQTGGIDGDEYHDIVTVRGEHEGTARILFTIEGTKRDAEANARLVAAAPDLLASLTDASIQCAGRRREKFREHRCATCAKWLDVIEKAVAP